MMDRTLQEYVLTPREFKREWESKTSFKNNKLQLSKPNARRPLMRNDVVETKSQPVDACMVVVAEGSDEDVSTMAPHHQREARSFETRARLSTP